MDKYNEEHESDGNTTMSFLAGVLIGGLAGAGAMLLLAPQSGKVTREQLQLKGIELSKQTTVALDDAMSQARGKANQISTGVREKAEELKQRGQDIFDEQKELLSTFVEGEKKAVKVAVKSSA